MRLGNYCDRYQDKLWGSQSFINKTQGWIIDKINTAACENPQTAVQYIGDFEGYQKIGLLEQADYQFEQTDNEFDGSEKDTQESIKEASLDCDINAVGDGWTVAIDNREGHGGLTFFDSRYNASFVNGCNALIRGWPDALIIRGICGF